MDQVISAPIQQSFIPRYFEKLGDKSVKIVAYSQGMCTYVLSTLYWIEISEAEYYDTAIDTDKVHMNTQDITRNMALETKNKLLEAQLKASSEYADFMEGCLVETLMVAYEALEKVDALIAAQTP